VSREPVDPAAQLRLAFEMFEVGVAMMRHKLRQPALSDRRVAFRVFGKGQRQRAAACDFVTKRQNSLEIVPHL
jgi:hypothetical protein